MVEKLLGLTTSRLKEPVIASLLGVILIFLLHFIFPSYINGLTKNTSLSFSVLWDSNHANEVFNARTTFSEFARRPITTGAQELLKDLAGLPLQFSFNLIVLTSFFLCCLVLHKICLELNPRNPQSYLSIYGFIFSYSTLFAFMGPMHTYDEPIQFLFLLLSFLFLLKNKQVASVMFFSFACITRESSFILLSFFYLYEKPDFKRTIMWIIPVVVYFLFLKLCLPKSVQEESLLFNEKYRFLEWNKNFKNWSSSYISLTSLFLVLAFPLFLIKYTLSGMNYIQKKILKKNEPLIYLNAVVVLIAGLAREARLFALPLIFIWPLLPAAISFFFTTVKNQSIGWTALLMFTIISFVFSFLLFGQALGRGGLLFQAYFFVYLLLWLIALKIGWRKKAPANT